jgi:hypothetical protein
MTLRNIPWSSLRFCVDGKIYAGEDGLLRWEEAKRKAILPQEYFEARKQRSDLVAAITAATF